MNWGEEAVTLDFGTSFETCLFTPAVWIHQRVHRPSFNQRSGIFDNVGPLLIEREHIGATGQQRSNEIQQYMDDADKIKGDQPEEVVNTLQQLKSTIEADPILSAAERRRHSEQIQSKILEIQQEVERRGTTSSGAANTSTSPAPVTSEGDDDTAEP